MHGTKFSTSVAVPPSPKDDVRGLLVAIVESLRNLANSKLAKWANIATIGGLVIGILSLLQGLLPQPPSVPKPLIAQLAFEITAPVDGASVGPSSDVRGTAPFDGKRHHYYLIVTPPQGSAQIQADPMDQSPDGELHGHAVFGNGSVGIGRTFTLQILECATAPRSLMQVLPDCQRSKALYVNREH